MKRISTFLAGMLTMVLIGSLGVSALAAFGAVTFNVTNLQVNGKIIFTKGEDYALDNGQRVPASITYTDEHGGGTTYLPVRRISEILGVDVGWDQSTDSVTVSKGIESETATEVAVIFGLDGTSIKKEVIEHDLSATVNGKRMPSDFNGAPTALAYEGITYLNAAAIASEVNITFDKEETVKRLNDENSPITYIEYKNATYFSARTIATLMDLEVSWDSDNKLVAIVSSNGKENDKETSKTTHAKGQACERGKQYTTVSGYGVTLNSAETAAVKGVPTFSFKYTLKNLTSDQYLYEDTFTIGFTDGTTTNQGGIYLDGMYPNETLTKTYSLILNGKTVSYLLFNDGSSFFLSAPKESDLDSHLIWYIE